MTTEQLINALREGNSSLLDAAADHLETADKSIRFLAEELASRVGEVEFYLAEIERLKKTLDAYTLRYGAII